MMYVHSVQFSSVTQSHPTLCDPVDRSTPSLPGHHQFPNYVPWTVTMKEGTEMGRQGAFRLEKPTGGFKPENHMTGVKVNH